VQYGTGPHREGTPYGSGAPYGHGSHGDGVPPRRSQGTVYGGSPVTSQPLTYRPLEHSGSLTGHILSQGTDTPPPKSRTTRVVVIMTVVLSVVVILGLIVAVFARNALLDILKGG
jgi:hypothetical protein